MTIVSLGKRGIAPACRIWHCKPFSDRAGGAEFHAGPAMTPHCRPKNKKPAEAGFLQGINAC